MKRSNLQIEDKAVADLQKHFLLLQKELDAAKATGQADEASVKRFDVYGQHQSRFVKQLERSYKEIAAGNRTAVQNILAGLFVGGTKVANRAEFAVAGYKYNNDARATNSLIGTSSIPYLAGTSFSILDNLRIQIQREVSNRRLAKRHELPGQLIRMQLDDLAQLEKDIQAL